MSGATKFYDAVADALQLGCAATPQSFEGDLAELRSNLAGDSAVKLVEVVYVTMALKKNPRILKTKAINDWSNEHADLLRELS